MQRPKLRSICLLVAAALPAIVGILLFTWNGYGRLPGSLVHAPDEAATIPADEKKPQPGVDSARGRNGTPG